MHDPMTVAFEIHYPWNWKIFHPSTWDCFHYQRLLKYGKDSSFYHDPFITIWHVDPEKDGTDDSCGYSYPKVTERDRELLEKEIKFSLDCNELFDKEGNSKFDPLSAIMSCADMLAWRMFKKEFTTKQLEHVMSLGINAFDNLRCYFEGKKNKEEIKHAYYLIFRCIKRILRPWYMHPKWHIWHWKIQIHPCQRIRRFLFDRCYVCGKGFKWGESPMSDWDCTKIWHITCDCVNQKPCPSNKETMINKEIQKEIK